MSLQLLEPLTGKEWSLADFAGAPLLVMFICNHCPFVVLLKGGLPILFGPLSSTLP
jgi:hypothetical protein